MAFNKGNEKIEKLLLEHGATPLDDDGKQKVLNKKLIRKCWEDNIEDELPRLLKAGFDINFKNDDGETCLYIATNSGNMDGVRILLENGADPDIKTEYGDSPLAVASGLGYNQIKKLLLKYGASPEE